MNELISLAVYVGRLEARLESLEKRLEDRDAPSKVQLGLGHTVPSAADEGADEAAQLASRLMQEGIDSIMSYQWPPKREGEE